MLDDGRSDHRRSFGDSPQYRHFSTQEVRMRVADAKQKVAAAVGPEAAISRLRSQIGPKRQIKFASGSRGRQGLRLKQGSFGLSLSDLCLTFS